MKENVKKIFNTNIVDIVLTLILLSSLGFMGKEVLKIPYALNATVVNARDIAEIKSRDSYAEIVKINTNLKALKESFVEIKQDFRDFRNKITVPPQFYLQKSVDKN